MKNKLRLLIREQVSKLFENDYNNSFEIEKIPEMRPGGAAYQAAIEDMEKDPSMGKHKEPSEKELQDIIDSLKKANLDLPSDSKDIDYAEKNLNLKLKYPKMNKFSVNQ
jgi:hypothetical protein